ncbi:dihydroorotase [Helicobacter sp. 13S00401-1]|uniref:dihydroorotase n=1 Tax=Helicobacter sp. 13S00401-1 TaxID=1905758 RepID=UPI000BA67701|nr:dihydroorotase [Helicobacter sp. 13S00401-1]PAF50774.1 dihydroorotase [Helicobacter sp. 13S00401-1]
MESITLKNPLDMHLHLREGEMLRAVLPYTAKPFTLALVMPNLKTPLIHTNLVKDYEKGILNLSKDDNFTPLMSLYISSKLSKVDLDEAKHKGVKILKLYPKGATTNSALGVGDVLDSKLLELLGYAEGLGFILSIHGESGGFSMEREAEFHPVFKELATSFPKLKIIIEHMSDRRSIKLIETHPNIYATLTPHHISMTLDDVIGGSLNPHHFCKPVLKTRADREALLELALSANPKISFGSDSAPHTIEAKLNGAAGIFNAPSILPFLCTLFGKHDKLENLQSFISDNAVRIYNLSFKKDKFVTLEKDEFLVPDSIHSSLGDVKVLFGGTKLEYKIKAIV